MAKSDKISISLPSTLGDNIREAARDAGVPLSAWVAEAAAARLRLEAFDAFFEQWERDHGPLTGEEIARAEQRFAERQPVGQRAVS
ncbi:MAG: hypothetical protein WD058_00150 [Dehalococcoidia bacterium]